MKAAAGLTAALTERCLAFSPREVPQDVRERARHSLLDWLSVTLLGQREAQLRPLLQELESEQSAEQCLILGQNRRMGLLQSVLANGMAGHILDFDDTHLPSRVHPSVPLWPVILGLAQRQSLGADEALAAFAAGVEMQARLGALMGASHYRLGWHNTATLGCFGACIAAARILGLGHEATQRALGIAASWAAGLRAAFGTPVKPLQVAHAAACGLRAARLAASGMAAPENIFDKPESFIGMYSSEHDASAAGGDLDHWHAREIVFKYHASCYGTHAPIEAASELRAQLAGAAIDSIVVKIEPQYMSVCNIAAPDSRLQARFSVRHAVALALTGGATAQASGYDAQARSDPALDALRARTRVEPDPGLARAHASVEIRTQAGQVLRAHADASRPQTDLDLQWRRLCAKSSAILEDFYPSEALQEFQHSTRALAPQEDLGSWLAHSAHALGGAGPNHQNNGD